MNYLKAFIAGIVIPATLLQIAVVIEFICGWPPIKESVFFHQLPILWAIWNITYVGYFSKIWPGKQTVSYMIHGAILGLIISIPAVFFLAIPESFGFKSDYQYIPLGLVPFIYALIWAFGVRPLNRAFNIQTTPKNG